MLLALLPLAGWAQGRALTNSDVEVSSVKYGAALPQPVVKDGSATLVRNTDYTWNGKYYSDNTCETEVTAKAVGTYYVKVEGTGTYSGTAIGSFAISKETLTVTVNSGNHLVKVYGDADPSADFIKNLTISATGFKYSETKSVIKGTLAMSGYTGNTTANANYNGTINTANAHKITFTGLSADNYDIAYADNYIDIKRRPIVDIADNPATTTVDESFTSNVTFAISKTSTSYNKKSQTPSYTVMFGTTKMNPSTSMQTKDYKVVYFASEANRTAGTSEVAATNVVNAKKYYTKIVGEGNYEGEYYVADDEDPKYGDYVWTINPSNLVIKAKDVVKTYDGVAGWNKVTFTAPSTYAIAPITQELEYYGLIAGDEGDITNPTISTDLSTVKNQGTYYLELTGGSSAAGNYNIILDNSGIFKINKRDLTLKANDKLDAQYGVVPTFTGANVTITGAVDYTISSVTYSDVATMKGTADGQGKLTVVTNTTATTAPGTYNTALSVSRDADADVWDNYNITEQTGKLVIAAKNVYISPIAASKIYGNADPESFDYTIIGLTKDQLKEIGTEPMVTREPGEDVDTYLLTAAGADAGDLYNIVYIDNVYFEITKAPLTVVPTTQVFAASTSDPTLVQTAVAMHGLKNGDTKANIAYKLSITPGATGYDSNVVGDYDVITVAAITDTTDPLYPTEDKSDNYDIDFSAIGTLSIGNTGTLATLAFQDADPDIVETLTANNGKNVNVTIELNRGSQYLPNTVAAANLRSWKKDCWNTMVLPFDVTPRQISEALGYGIVNVVKKNGATITTNKQGTEIVNVAFELKLFGTIEANTPFVVKTDVDIPNSTIATFNDVTIDYAAADLVVDAGLGAEFIGTYTSKVIDPKTRNDETYLAFLTGDSNKWSSITSTTGGNKWTILPFAAYLNLEPAAQGGTREFTFTFEEADGSTTTVGNISADEINSKMNAEGWYTVNGMKLNAQPTQKGVYILNGKKIVVK